MEGIRRRPFSPPQPMTRLGCSTPLQDEPPSDRRLGAGRSRRWTSKNAFDADGDGKVGRAELLHLLDADGDGDLSREEIEYFNRQTSVASAVASIVCEDKVHPATKMIFSRLDSGGDGVITRAELAKVLKKLPPPTTASVVGSTIPVAARAASFSLPPAPSSTPDMFASCAPRLATNATWYSDGVDSAADSAPSSTAGRARPGPRANAGATMGARAGAAAGTVRIGDLL